MTDNTAGPAAIHAQVFISNRFNCACIVILYYDYFLTFPAEYNRYWKARRKFTLAHILFCLNRYTLIVGYIPLIFLWFWPWSESIRFQTCLRINEYNESLIVGIQIIVGGILILRTYALYENSWRILVLLCSVGLAAVVYGLFAVFSLQVGAYTPHDLPSTECLLPASGAMTKGLSQAWIGNVFFDTLVFSLTLIKALRTKREGSSILDVIMRDGAMYFGVMILTSISVIISFRIFRSEAYLTGMTATLTNVLSSTMISRLMLNLRDPKLLFENASKAQPSMTVSGELVFHHEGSTFLDGHHDIDGPELFPNQNVRELRVTHAGKEASENV